MHNFRMLYFHTSDGIHRLLEINVDFRLDIGNI